MARRTDSDRRVGAGYCSAGRIRVGMCKGHNLPRVDTCSISARGCARDANWFYPWRGACVIEAPSNTSLERTRDR